jgi:signal transduction histidine kinase
MRTPLSIATGYVDLLCVGATDAKTEEDLAVVREELDRVSMATGRMLRLIRLYEDLPVDRVDIDELLDVTATRWGVVADRQWEVDSRLGVQEANEERVRACVDTLVENAVRYTEPGDVIRLFARKSGNVNEMGVADSGPGFSEAQLQSINARGSDVDISVPLVSDPRSQTGLGLSLVREVVESRGARLVAGRSPEGGAEVRMVAFPGVARRERIASGEPISSHVAEWWSAQVAPAPDRFLPSSKG